MKTVRMFGFCMAAAAVVAVVPFSDALAQHALRDAEAVVIKGAMLGPMAGSDIESLSLFAEQDGGFGPVPFQVDEMTECSVRRFGYQQVYAGTVPGRKCQTDQPGLDRDDELVFLAVDAGGQVVSSYWPNEAKAGIEIRLTDPLTGQRRYAYLFAFDGKAPRSDIDYVEYDPSRDLVRTGKYEMGFSAASPLTADRISIPESNAGGGRDILDSLKIRADIILFGVFTHTLNNNDYASKVLGYIDGPVRVVRVTGTIGEVWLFTQVRKVFTSRHYPYFAEYDLRFNLIGAEGKLDVSLDMNQEAAGMMFYSQNNLSGAEVDGVTREDERNMEYGQGEWVALSGDQGSLLVRLILPAESRAFQDLYFIDDAEKQDEPEDEPGQMGRMGFSISPVEKIEAADNPIKLVFYFPQIYLPGDEGAYIEINNSPLEVGVDANITRQAPAAPLLPDYRTGDEAPVPTFETRTMAESKTKGIMPVPLLDPNLGYGGGVAYMDRDFLGQGMKADIGVTISHRLYQSYYADIREIPWIPWIDNPQVNVSFDNHPNRYYYGEGNISEMDHLAVYKRDDFYVQFLAEKYFARHFGLGLMFEYHDVNVDHGEMVTGEYDSIEEHYGPDEDILDGERWGPEIYGWGRSNTSRVQLSGFIDYRDSEYYPTKGVYLKVFEDVVSPSTGADYNFNKTKVQGSFYLSPSFFNPEKNYLQTPGYMGWRRKLVGPDKNRVLAMRFTVQDIEGEEIEFEGREILDAPFFELSMLGDGDLMRGYYEGRRRDNDLVDVQVEYRWHVYKDKFGAFLFADAGRVFYDVWEYMDEEDPFDEENLLITYGFGVAFTIVPEYIQCITFGFSEEEAMLNYFFGWYRFEDYPRNLRGASRRIFW